jgi:hypothetical protein
VAREARTVATDRHAGQRRDQPPHPRAGGVGDFHEIEVEPGHPKIYTPVYWSDRHVWLLDPDPDLTPYEVFSGANKEELREFIAFCRAGGFEGG